MTQEKISKYFQTSLGEQCTTLYSTPDDRVFIRPSEAENHCIENGMDPLSVSIWFDETEEQEPPTYEQCVAAMNSAIGTLINDHPEYQEENSTGWDLLETLRYIKSRFIKYD